MTLDGAFLYYNMDSVVTYYLLGKSFPYPLFAVLLIWSSTTVSSVNIPGFPMNFVQNATAPFSEHFKMDVWIDLFKADLNTIELYSVNSTSGMLTLSDSAPAVSNATAVHFVLWSSPSLVHVWFEKTGSNVLRSYRCLSGTITALTRPSISYSGTGEWIVVNEILLTEDCSLVFIFLTIGSCQSDRERRSDHHWFDHVVGGYAEQLRPYDCGGTCYRLRFRTILFTSASLFQT